MENTNALIAARAIALLAEFFHRASLFLLLFASLIRPMFSFCSNVKDKKEMGFNGRGLHGASFEHSASKTYQKAEEMQIVG